MGKSKEKKSSGEVKADKKLTLRLGVKKKQLKKKKDRVLDGAVESEGVAGHNFEDKEFARSKQIVVMKQKKKNKNVKVHTKASGLVELQSDSKDDTAPKLKKQKNKKKLKEANSPVELQKSPFNSNEAGTLKLKEKKRKVKEGKTSVGPNDGAVEETRNADVNQLAAHSEVVDIGSPEKAKKAKKNKTKKVKQSGKANKTDMPESGKENKLERNFEVDTANANEITSVDEDCSKGMKKWILEYKQKRPGLKILQQRIDEFITAHEEQQEQERKEREARAAEDGWTVVAHHKGRKKTTDAETGTAVGSVSLAAMQEKMSKQKPKEVGLNFYRFQKREAQISELAMLQSKFEQDKKRIQQLRAQRKFKPY